MIWKSNVTEKGAFSLDCPPASVRVGYGSSVLLSFREGRGPSANFFSDYRCYFKLWLIAPWEALLAISDHKYSHYDMQAIEWEMNSIKYSMWTREISEEISNNVEEICTQNEGLSRVKPYKVLKVIQHDSCYIFKKRSHLIWLGRKHWNCTQTSLSKVKEKSISNNEVKLLQQPCLWDVSLLGN